MKYTKVENGHKKVFQIWYQHILMDIWK